MRYFLGIDVGGTKTHAMVADESGQACGFGLSGPGNHEGVGYDGLSTAMQAAAQTALQRAGITAKQIAGAGFGLGGFDWQSELPPTLEAIKPLGLSAPLSVVNDAMIGLLAGAREGWGIAVVAGTGCNCWGRNRQHKLGHCTGMGGWMGEGAGAGELVSEAVRRVSRAWSMRGPATRLTDEFCKLAGAKNGEQLLEWITLEQVYLDSEAAPIIFSLAEEGDTVAGDLIHWAGEALADLAIGVIHQIGIENEQFEAVEVGSLFNGGPMLVDPMVAAIQKVAPGAKPVKLEVPPVLGGVLLGMEQTGLATPALREKLIQSTLDRLA